MKVKKNNGQVVDFDKEKIKKVLVAAGLQETEADRVATEVETWAENTGKETVEAREIKQKIISLLPSEVVLKIRNYIKQRRS